MSRSEAATFGDLVGRDPGELLPHGRRFLLVDEIIAFDGTRIITARNVPEDEFWTTAHFPGNPMVPGVLLIEGMAQTCGLLIRALASSATRPRQTLLAGVESSKFLKIVRPGSRLTYEAQVAARAMGLHLCDAKTFCEGALVAKARVCLSSHPER